MSEKEKKELEVRNVQAPAFIPTDVQGGDGFENATFEDFSTPFLRILQPQSPQLIEEDDSYIDGAKPGMFFNTITNRLYGKEVNLIPVGFETVHLAWAPNQGGFRGQYSPAEAKEIGHKVAGERDLFDDDGNALAKTMTFYLLIEGHEEDGLLAFSLSSTSLKLGRKWLSKMQMLCKGKGNIPMFATVWNVKAVMNKNDKGQWYMIGEKNTTAEFVKYVNESQFALASEAHSLIAELKVDYSKMEGGESERNVTEEASGAFG